MRNLLILLIIFCAVFHSCNFEDEPLERPYFRLEVSNIDEVNMDGATFSAKLLANGNGQINAYGFVWGTVLRPRLENSAFELIEGNLEDIGSFTARIERDLIEGEMYYVAAFARTDEVTSYSIAKTFEAKGSILENIFQISTMEGSWGDTVEVSSSEFITGIENTKILFGSTEVNILGHQGETIFIEVPQLLDDSVSVRILENDLEIFEFNTAFKYLKPVINGTDPERWNEFDTITIQGENFTQFIDFNEIRINGQEAEIIEHSKTTLKIIAPLLNSSNRYFDINVISSGVDLSFRAFYNPPIITEVIPSIITSFDLPILVKGKNFGTEDLSSMSIYFTENLWLYLSDPYPSNNNVNERELFFDNYYQNLFGNVELKGTYQLGENYNDPNNASIDFNIDGIYKIEKDLPVEITDGASTFLIDDKFYIGLDENGNNSDFWSFDFTNDRWNPIEAFPGEATQNSTAITVDQVAYVGLGKTNSNTIANDIYKYDPSSNTWELETNLPYPLRFSTSAFNSNNKIYFCGGILENSVRTSEVLTYDLQNKTWDLGPSFPQGNRLIKVAQGQNSIYASMFGLFKFENDNWIDLNLSINEDYNFIGNYGDHLYLNNQINIKVINKNTLASSNFNLPQILNNELYSIIYNDRIYLLSAYDKIFFSVDINDL